MMQMKIVKRYTSIWRKSPQGVYMLGKFQDEGANLMQVLKIWRLWWEYDDVIDGGGDEEGSDD